MLNNSSRTIKLSFTLRKVALLVVYTAALWCLSLHDVTLTDFTLHFSCCFTNLLHSHFVSLLNNFTMQEKCY